MQVFLLCYKFVCMDLPFVYIVTHLTATTNCVFIIIYTCIYLHFIYGEGPIYRLRVWLGLGCRGFWGFLTTRIGLLDRCATGDVLHWDMSRKHSTEDVLHWDKSCKPSTGKMLHWDKSCKHSTGELLHWDKSCKHSAEEMFHWDKSCCCFSFSSFVFVFWSCFIHWGTLDIVCANSAGSKWRHCLRASQDAFR